jgi:hypothetical protein
VCEREGERERRGREMSGGEERIRMVEERIMMTDFFLEA